MPVPPLVPLTLPRLRRLLAALIVLAMLLAVVITGIAGWAAPRAAAQNPCEGLVAPRLSIGGSAQIVSTYGVSLKDRALTGAAGANEVALLPYGTVLSVQEGPVCNLGYVWWRVQLADGTSGWAAEGSTGANYFMEPLAIGLHVFEPSADATQIAHYFVTPDGRAEPRGTFTIPPLSVTPEDVWQAVEIETLRTQLAAVQSQCPQRLTGDWASLSSAEDEALAWALPAYDYDFYPAPSGEQLVLVRHQQVLVPRCETVVPRRVGMSSVSILRADGTETALFPFPQHGSVPESQDIYTDSEPDNWNVYLAEVTWSPHERYVAFVAAYRTPCNRADCYRFHMYIANLESGQLYVLGEGRHLGWTNGGEGVNFFRLIGESGGRALAHLYTARPDGSARQEIWLPGGAVYVSPEQAPYGFPWNDSGTRVLVANAGLGEVMLLNLGDRAFTPPVVVPDKMPRLNRLGVALIRGERELLWTTIRGEFAVQNLDSGRWRMLASDASRLGVPPEQVRVFPNGAHALIELAGGRAFVLDIAADTLIEVAFGG